MKLVCAVLLALAFCRPAACAPLIANGSFESGNFASWMQSGNTEYTSVSDEDYDGLSPQDGADYALLGPAGADGILAQSFTDTPGTALRISFWLASDGGTPSDFSATYDGRVLSRLADAGVFGWTEYTTAVTGTGADTLAFSFRDDQDYFALDNIVVSEVDAVAEPPGALLFALGILAAAIRRRASMS